MPGENFPIKNRDQLRIIDAETITRGGSWWVAILLLEDQSSKRYIELYKWQSTPEGWKTRKAYKVNHKAEAKHVIEVISRMENWLD